MPNIKSALSTAVKSLDCATDSPLLDAEILLCLILEKDRAYLRAWPELDLTGEQYHGFLALIAKRRQGVPIAYLTGTREFWSRDFQVSPDVLIPRPETELLIELGLALIPANQAWRILDLGTGSGIISVTLAVERPDARVSATDISPAALLIAKANAAKHQAERIQFYQSHWFDNIPGSKFDLIVSNPPYLAAYDEHLHQGDLRFEPKTALIAARQGLGDIETIAESARNWLENGGFLLVEHGYNQREDVQSIFRLLGYQHVQTYSDLSGQPRATSGQYLPPA